MSSCCRVRLLVTVANVSLCSWLLSQRVVPYLVALLTDKASYVRAHALCALTHTLCQVATFPPSDAQVFTSYILPALSKLPSDQEIIVQLAFAECLPLVCTHLSGVCM